MCSSQRNKPGRHGTDATERRAVEGWDDSPTEPPDGPDRRFVALVIGAVFFFIVLATVVRSATCETATEAPCEHPVSFLRQPSPC